MCPSEFFNPSVTISMLASGPLSSFQQVHIDFQPNLDNVPMIRREVVHDYGKMTIGETSEFYFERF